MIYSQKRVVKIIKVEEWMTKPIVSLDSQSTIEDAVHLMSKENIGVVAIIDNGNLKGIVTERDIIHRVLVKEINMKNTKLVEVMTEAPKTINFDATVLDVTKMMTDNNFRRLIIKKEDEIVGIVTAKDVIKLMSA